MGEGQVRGPRQTERSSVDFRSVGWGLSRKKEALPDSVMQAIDAVHMRNRLPIFSSNRYQVSACYL